MRDVWQEVCNRTLNKAQLVFAPPGIYITRVAAEPVLILIPVHPGVIVYFSGVWVWFLGGMRDIYRTDFVVNNSVERGCFVAVVRHDACRFVLKVHSQFVSKAPCNGLLVGFTLRGMSAA